MTDVNDPTFGGIVDRYPRANSGWSGDNVLTIRDFRHARYAIEGAEVVT